VQKPLIIARQSAHPRGLLGHLVARLMARETRAVNRWVRGALEPSPGERILDLGCGHGRTLAHVARAAAPGLVVGVDPSKVMRRVARRHLRTQIRAGQVRVEPGDSGSIPAPDAAFDKAYTVHTLYFWPDLDAGLRELHRVLRPGGLLLLAFHTSENAARAAELPSPVYTLRPCQEVIDALVRAGFSQASQSVDELSAVRLVRGLA
jgi:ubiquinone/menaquinone biosynthesis C-methylase UbiE